jgi:sulfatase maturation enzyme AslB (radical SAM superfamily)
MWQEIFAFFTIMLSLAYMYGLTLSRQKKEKLDVMKGKKKRRAMKTTEMKKTTTSESKDIEDLGKSLIPRTLKSMKKKKWKALTVQEKLKKRSDLREKKKYPPFRATLHKNKIKLKRTPAQVLQLNIGLYCNQACSHCHVDSTPRRKEMMSRETADHCLRVLRNSPSVKVLDLTGGAPELNREFRHLVKGARSMGIEVIDRCNLTVLLEPRQENLATFLRDNQVHIIASLPYVSLSLSLFFPRPPQLKTHTHTHTGATWKPM